MVPEVTFIIILLGTNLEYSILLLSNVLFYSVSGIIYTYYEIKIVEDYCLFSYLPARTEFF